MVGPDRLRPADENPRGCWDLGEQSEPWARRSPPWQPTSVPGSTQQRMWPPNPPEQTWRTKRSKIACLIRGWWWWCSYSVPGVSLLLWGCFLSKVMDIGEGGRKVWEAFTAGLGMLNRVQAKAPDTTSVSFPMIYTPLYSVLQNSVTPGQGQPRLGGQCLV